jgi:hypothetical protein
MSKQPECSATRKDGRPCTAPALPGEVHCFGHSPGLAAQRAAGVRRGGQHKASIVRLKRLAPPALVSVFDRLDQTLDQVLAGDLDPKIATAAAQVARAMVATVQHGEHEERLRQLEGRAG